MKKETKNSKAYSKRKQAVMHPAFPAEPSDAQPAHMGSQSSPPPQDEGFEPGGNPVGPSQDMSFGRGG